MKKQVKYSINDDYWKFSVLSDENYVKKHGMASVGMTTFDIYEVDFKKSEFNLRSLRHEITHIHFHYCFLDSVNSMTLADQEEVFCELVAYRNEKIQEQAKEIFKRLKK